MFKRTTRFFLFMLAWFAIALPSIAHEGHDEPQAPQQSAETPRIAIGGARYDVVATPAGHVLTIYLDDADSNEPAIGATLIVGLEGKTAVQATEIGQGLFQLDANWIDEPGTYPLAFTIEAGDSKEVLKGSLVIPQHGHDEASSILPLRDVMGRPDILAALAIAFALGAFIVLGLRRRPRDIPGRDTAALAFIVTLLAASSLLSPALADAGHDHDHGDSQEHADHNHDAGRPTAGQSAAAPSVGGNVPKKFPDGSVFVPKTTQRLLQVRTTRAEEGDAPRIRTLLGTVISDPSAFGQVQAPMDGQVELSVRGISYAGQKVEAGEVLALLTPTIPLADLGTMQQLRAEVDGKLIIAEQKLSRLTRIANVIAQRDIDDTRAELEALREQKRVLAPKGVEKFELKAPVSGIISIANVRAGQVVSARDTLFEIVDPNKLWVEAVGANLHNEGAAQTAHAIDTDGHSIKLGYAGRSPTLRQQSQPYLFRVEELHSGLAIGAPVRVLVQTDDVIKGVTIPDTAIVRANNGLQQVWIKIAPEVFRPVTVRSEPLDGAQTLVLDGLHAGDRVVVSGTELINQIR